jgi:hypothetical protein
MFLASCFLFSAARPSPAEPQACDHIRPPLLLSVAPPAARSRGMTAPPSLAAARDDGPYLTNARMANPVRCPTSGMLWCRTGALVSTTRRQSSKSEIRWPKSEGNPNSEARSTSRSGAAAARRRKAGFGFRISVFLRISAFGPPRPVVLIRCPGARTHSQFSV